MINAVFIILGLIIFINYIKILLKSEKPAKKAAGSMLTGVLSLSAASFITGVWFMGAQVVVNLYTTFIALTLGIPGVVFLVLKMFI